jgi:hypothetical protein
MGVRAELGRGRIDDPVTGRFLDPNYSGCLVPTNTGIPSAASIVETAVSRQKPEPWRELSTKVPINRARSVAQDGEKKYLLQGLTEAATVSQVRLAANFVEPQQERDSVGLRVPLSSLTLADATRGLWKCLDMLARFYAKQSHGGTAMRTRYLGVLAVEFSYSSFRALLHCISPLALASEAQAAECRG